MKNFNISTNVYFGENSLGILDEIKNRSVLIICDSFMESSGIVDKIKEHLKSCQVYVFSKVIPDPPIEIVSEGIKCLSECKAEIMIAVGGGSSIDAAKAIRELSCQLKIADIHECYAIPTTSGTGSEVTRFSVITNAQEGAKYPLVNDSLQPMVAILDPELVQSVPPAITADTGMDALTHAIEGYITKAAWEMTDMFHIKAIELIAKHLKGAVENTPEGREGMALAQYIAGMGFSNVGLGIVHSMAHPLGALYDTPHGIANAIILPTVMEYNASYTGEKYREIARAFGVEELEKMSQEEYRTAAIQAVKKLSKEIGIPTDLKEIVKEEDLDFLSESAFNDVCTGGNPRETSSEEIKRLYESLI